MQEKEHEVENRYHMGRGWICLCDTINNGYGKCSQCGLYRCDVEVLVSCVKPVDKYV